MVVGAKSNNKRVKGKVYLRKFDLLYHLGLRYTNTKGKLFKRITPIYSFCDLQKGISYESLAQYLDSE